MEIRSAHCNDFNELCRFNQQMFKEKKVDSKDYINFWASKNEDAIKKMIILLDDNKCIHGQILASSMLYYYQQQTIDSVWLFDLIIEENFRKSAWGVDLLLECMGSYPNSCSTGSGPTALPIHLKLGNSYLGEIKKYVGLVAPQFLFISLFNKVEPSRSPNLVTVGTASFKRITVAKLPSYTSPFNKDLLEIGRDMDFLKWRFFNNLHQYAFYLRKDNQSYFVLRSISLKGFRVMELVDFRCKNTEEDFEYIYQAAVLITKSVHLPVLVCGSSLASFDRVLEQHHFKSIGRPRPILGFVNCKDRKKDIENRNFCFVTLADSDGETNWV